MLLRLGVVWIGVATAMGATGACAEVRVRTADARELAGVVDARTDDSQLWLRREFDQMVIASPVAWSLVESAEVDGERVRADDLKATLVPLATEGPSGITSLPAAPHPRNTPRLHSAPRHRVRSLKVDAVLANLDKDASPDGIEVAIAALDDHGRATPVRGNLAVRLWGERDVPADRRESRFFEVQRWNQAVALDDFVDGVAVYRLRFRTVHLERDLELWPDAMVLARLSAHGQGVFEASRPMWLRRVSPYRDRLQLFTGNRLVPNDWGGPARIDQSSGDPRAWRTLWAWPH